MPVPVSPPGVSLMCIPHREQLVEAGLAMQKRVIDHALADDSHPPLISRTVKVGQPFDVLRRESVAADLVVLGWSRRARLRRLASRCARHLECPVVVVNEDRLC